MIKKSAFAELCVSPWTIWTGLRYLKSKKSSGFLSFITVLSVLGVGLGVTAMLVVLSVMDGFEDGMKSRLMSSDLHVLISPGEEIAGFHMGRVPSGSFEKTQAFETLKNDPQVIGVWPVLATEAILKTGKRVSGVEVKGITGARLEKLRGQITEWAEAQFLQEKEGTNAIRLPGIFVGQELAYFLGAIPGDRVTLVSPTETQGPLSRIPQIKRFVVEGIYNSGIPEQELHTVFTNVEAVESFLRQKSVVSAWEVSLKSFERAPDVAERIRPEATGFRVQDWIQMNAHLFSSLKLERFAMFVALLFTIIVASFNIISTLTLMVTEKKRDIGILKTMGATRAQVGAIFLAEGLLIGLVGIFFGLLAAFGICTFLDNTTAFKLPEFYYDRTIPVTFKTSYYALVGVSAFVVVLLACWYPSRKAASLHPLEGIRLG